MPFVISPEKVRADVAKILEVWKANADFTMKDVTVQSLDADSSQLDAVLSEIATLELNATPLRIRRDELARKLNETCMRARAGFKGYFGPNSSQYEQAGGTRTAERKKPVRRALAIAAASS